MDSIKLDKDRRNEIFRYFRTASIYAESMLDSSDAMGESIKKRVTIRMLNKKAKSKIRNLLDVTYPGPKAVNALQLKRGYFSTACQGDSLCVTGLDIYQIY